MTHKPSYLLLGLITALLSCLADQCSKYALLEWVDIDSRPPIAITPFFNLVMVWNHGVSFGMFSEQRMPWLLIGLATLIIIILLRWLMRVTDRIEVLAIGLVIGGATGNVIDRLRFGAVADFFDMHLMNYHWPAFNLADSVIFIGVVVLCIRSMMQPSRT